MPHDGTTKTDRAAPARALGRKGLTHGGRSAGGSLVGRPILGGSFLAALLALVASLGAAEDPRSAPALVLTRAKAIVASRVRLDGPRLLVDTPGDAGTTELPLDGVLLVRFHPVPCDRPPASWLCLRDGQVLRGEKIVLSAAGITLKSSRGDCTASVGDATAVFFRAGEPVLEPRPAVGVRIVSVDGEPLQAPGIALSEEGALVDVDPGADPVRLPLERLAGIVWADTEGRAGRSTPTSREPAASRDRGPGMARVDLRTGERLVGALQALDGRSLTLHREGSRVVLDRREIQALWIAGRPGTTIQGLPAAPSSSDRPLWRVGRNALGVPLRIGQRAYSAGVGLRGSASVEIPVPRGSTWFLVDAGVDSDAASHSLATLEVLVGGQSRARLGERRPGMAAEALAVLVVGASSITLRVTPSGDSTGCLGDFCNAIFIE